MKAADPVSRLLVCSDASQRLFVSFSYVVLYLFQVCTQLMHADFLFIWQVVQKTKVIKARFKRRTLHVPNLMQMSENNRFFSFALDSAHVKFDV